MPRDPKGETRPFVRMIEPPTKRSDLRARSAVVLVAVVPAFFSPAFAQTSQPERVAQLLGTVRVLTDRCKITGDPEILSAAVRRAGFELTDFVPGARFWQYTRKAMDQRFALIAKQGLGGACNVMNETVQATLPGY
jgi:hypothetical protein